MGPLWRGSNAGGLFKAMSRCGCLIAVVDEFYYISLSTKTKLTKVLERFVRPLQVDEYNKAIIKEIDIFTPDILFVYKGAFVKPEVLQYAREKKCRLVMFYPDVSTMTHGDFLPKTIPLYELIFTTKTFGIRDMQEKFGAKNLFFIPHGFDPEIHRVLEINDADRATFGCDVSFIGTYSLKKEQLLNHLKEQIPDLNLKIWGEQWHKSSSPAIKDCIKGRQVLGDLFALAIQCSKINLGILSEKVVGASSGDLITSRTFHIPGSSGFMLHERNEESVLYFKEDEESGFFEGAEELTAKVKLYLKDDALRERVRLAGYQRALADHSLDSRARTIIQQIQKL